MRSIWRLFRALFHAIVAPVAVLAMIPILGIGKQLLYDNPVYAARVFADLPHDTVLASRRWHPLFGGRPGWDCTYAVVGLAEAPEVPPSVLAGQEAWDLDWGPGDWVATPGWAPCDNCRDAVAMCSADFDADTATRLARALARPGSWAQSDRVGETVWIYSAPERIAVRIRFGD
ncbi:MAG: hypothetical protein KDK53_05375 [Maritimibacter sp.]|nr:hypothetical protein [Maritimibacter sp.]